MRKADRYICAAAALLWLASCGKGADESSSLMDDLRSNNVLLKVKAIGSASANRDMSAVPEIISLLDSPFEEVRVKSVMALGAIGSQEAVPALIKRLDDGSLEVRREAVTALGKLKNPEAIPPLIRHLVDEEIELAIIWATGNIGDKSAIPVLNELMASDDPYIRYNASRALSKIK